MAAPIIQFEDVEIDLGKFQVRRAGRRVRLEKQPFDLLLLLLRKRGDLVPRKEIADSLWGPNVFVETDRSINNAVRKIRLALRDDPEHPRFIETVTGRGYRFIATASLSSGSQPQSSSEQVVSSNGHHSLARNDSVVPAAAADNPVTAGGAKRLVVKSRVKWILLSVVAFLLIAAAIWELRQKSDPKKEPSELRTLTYRQITNFTDTVVSPALSHGPDPSIFACVKTTMHRNLYRIPVS